MKRRVQSGILAALLVVALVVGSVFSNGGTAIASQPGTDDGGLTADETGGGTGEGDTLENPSGGGSSEDEDSGDVIDSKVAGDIIMPGDEGLDDADGDGEDAGDEYGIAMVDDVAEDVTTYTVGSNGSDATYSTISAAMSAASTDENTTYTIQLLTDISENVSITTANLDITIDLNGCTLKGTTATNSVISMSVASKITLTDSQASDETYDSFEDIPNYDTVFGSDESSFEAKTVTNTGDTTTYTTYYTAFDEDGNTVYRVYTSGGLTGSSTSSSKPTSGGGIYISSASAEFTMDGGTITGNYASSYGGGVYFHGGSSDETVGTLTMNAGVISANTSSSMGGGIHVTDYTDFVMNGGAIFGNSANNGGGLYANWKCTITLNDGSEIIGNKATSGNGGGLNIEYSDVLNLNGGVIADNTASSCGGGVYVYENNGGTQNDSINITGGMISGNTASSGGGIYCSGVYSSEDSIDVVMSGGAITGNTATSTGNGGGGLYLNNESFFTMTGGEISENTAYEGGGIYANYNIVITISGGEISDNCTSSGGKGGGIYTQSATTITMSGGTISGNEAAGGDGGGLYMYEGSSAGTSLTMSGGSITGNSATHSDNASNGGGGLVLYGGSGAVTLTMNGGEVSENTTTSAGGGVYMAGSNENLNLNGGSINGNESGDKGGGVYLGWSGTQTKVTMTGGEICDNVSKYEGGGVFGYGTLVMSGGKITGNNAGSYGGGVYINLAQNQGAVQLSGTPVIKENYGYVSSKNMMGEETNLSDLYLYGGGNDYSNSYTYGALNLTAALTDGAEVWVTTPNLPTISTEKQVTFFGSYATDSAQYFHSDMGCKVKSETSSSNSSESCVVLAVESGTVTYSWGDGGDGVEQPTYDQITTAATSGSFSLPNSSTIALGYDEDAEIFLKNIDTASDLDQSLLTVSSGSRASITTTRTVNGETVSGKWVFTGWVSSTDSDVLTTDGLTYVAQWGWRSDNRDYTVYFCYDTTIGTAEKWDDKTEFYIYGFTGGTNSGFQKMTQVDGVLYSYTFESTVYESIIFIDQGTWGSNGDGTVQTVDISVDWDDYADDEYPAFKLAGWEDGSGKQEVNEYAYTKPSEEGRSDDDILYVSVDLVDYLNDSRVEGETSNQGTWLEADQPAFTYLNYAISSQGYENPLYFGALLYTNNRVGRSSLNSSSYTNLTNWNTAANLALMTASGAGNYDAAVQGLVGDSLKITDADGNEVDDISMPDIYDYTWDLVDSEDQLLPYFSKDMAESLTVGGSKVMTYYSDYLFPMIVSEVEGSSPNVKEYHYSSSENYAVYLPSSGKTMERKWNYIYDEDTLARGYFPLNSANGTTNDRADAVNYGFGTKFTIPFTVNENGTIDATEDGAAITFNFTGDDDMWIFIDGKLVLDLGGDHGLASGTIDFKNLTATATNAASYSSYSGGTVNGDLTKITTYTGSSSYKNASGSTYEQRATINSGVQTVSLADIFGADYAATFQDSDEIHVLTMYYMERGMYDSNLSIDFTFHPLPSDLSVSVDVDTTGVNDGLAETVDNQVATAEDFPIAINSSDSENGTYTAADSSISYKYVDADGESAKKALGTAVSKNGIVVGSDGTVATYNGPATASLTEALATYAAQLAAADAEDADDGKVSVAKLTFASDVSVMSEVATTEYEASDADTDKEEEDDGLIHIYTASAFRNTAEETKGTEAFDKGIYLDLVESFADANVFSYSTVTSDYYGTNHYSQSSSGSGDATLDFAFGKASTTADEEVRPYNYATNFTNYIDLGNVTVTKLWDDDGTGIEPTDDDSFAFAILIDLDGDGAVYDYTGYEGVVYTISGTEYSTGAGGSFTLAAGQTATFTGIPAGANVKVSETTASGTLASGDEWKLDGDNGIVAAIAKDETAAISLTDKAVTEEPEPSPTPHNDGGGGDDDNGGGGSDDNGGGGSDDNGGGGSDDNGGGGTTPTGGTSTVQTGDGSHVGIYIALLCICAAAAASAGATMRRRRRA